MLNGKKLSICEKCYWQEQNGQDSFRTSVNDRFAHHTHRIEQTDKSGFLKESGIPYLDIRFSNLCNLKCRICAPHLSSSWYDDGKKLYPFFERIQKTKVLRIDKDVDALWEQLDPHIENLESIQFAGGEPLLMEEHLRILVKLQKLKKFDIHISYNTNLTVSHFKQSNIFEIWKEFSDVLVMASLDGMGNQGELLRKGQNWKRTEQLRRDMMKTCPNVTFRLDPTVSVHNVLHVLDFYKEWYEKGLIGVNDIRVNFLYEPLYYSMKILNRGARLQVINSYATFIEDYLNIQPNIEPQTIDNFQAVINHLERDSVVDKVKRPLARFLFHRVTNKLDGIRDEKFARVFPESKLIDS